VTALSRDNASLHPACRCDPRRENARAPSTDNGNANLSVGDDKGHLAASFVVDFTGGAAVRVGRENGMKDN